MKTVPVLPAIITVPKSRVLTTTLTSSQVWPGVGITLMPSDMGYGIPEGKENYFSLNIWNQILPRSKECNSYWSRNETQKPTICLAFKNKLLFPKWSEWPCVEITNCMSSGDKPFDFSESTINCVSQGVIVSTMTLHSPVIKTHEQLALANDDPSSSLTPIFE